MTNLGSMFEVADSGTFMGVPTGSVTELAGVDLAIPDVSWPSEDPEDLPPLCCASSIFAASARCSGASR